MVRIVLLLACLLLPLEGVAQQAHVTLVIKSSHQYSLALQRELYGMYHFDVINDVHFDRDTIVVLTVDPDTSLPYRMLDPGKLVFESFYLEAEDSLVFLFDMNEGVSSLKDDRRGYFTKRLKISEMISAKRSFLDSLSKVVSWKVFQRIVDASMQELRLDLRQRILELGRSIHARLANDLLDFTTLDAKLKYLESIEWTDDLRESFKRDRVPLIEELNRLAKARNSYLSKLVSSALGAEQVRLQYAGEEWRPAYLKLETLKQFEGAALDLALAYKIQNSLLDYSDAAGIARMDSLLRILPIADPVILAGVRKSLDRRRVLLPGSTAPNYELPDTSGVIRRLTDHIGKVVLLDFWGTWCSPCVRSIPDVKALAEEYSNTALAIVGVAIEGRAVARWRKYIRTKQMNWHHVYAEGQFWNEVVDQFGVGSVPRYMLIGKDGRIIHADAPDPSSKQLRQLIDEALSAPIN